MENKPISEKQSVQPQRINKSLLIILLLLPAVLAGVGGYWLGIKTKQRSSPMIQTVLVTTVSSPTVTKPFPSLEVAINDTWHTYTDATLGATLEYPTTWKLINTRSNPSQKGTGLDYSLTFEDTTVPQHRVSIYISSISNPENLSLADFYRRYLPDGAKRFANIAFQETINPHGVRFEKIVQPFVSPDTNDTLETVHNSRIYEITKTIAVPLSSGFPVEGDYHQDPIFQKAVAEYNHLINSFAFTN